jgi:predicted XRE-type DNA-binding protein
MALKMYSSPFHATHSAGAASKLALKVDLMALITSVIKKRGLTQAKAAELLGLHQSRISEIKNVRIDKFTLDALLDVLDKLGCGVVLTLKDDLNVEIRIESPSSIESQ